MGRIIVALCLGLVTAGACYSPPHPECGFVCGTSGQCPADYSCNSVDRVCHLNGSSPTMLCAHDAAVGSEPPPPDAASFHVLGTEPTNGDIHASRTQDILAQFDRSAMAGTITNVSFLVTKGGVAQGGVVSYVDGPNSAHFTPSPALPPGATILVQLTSDILSNQSESLQPYTFSFTTIDDVAPTVVTTSPLDMATNVLVSSVITVTFSEPVANVSATTFAVTQGATTITGTLTSGDAITYTMTPDADLPAASVITVSLTAGITDVANNPLAPVQFTFMTP
jgi:hypothetical protein